MSCKCGLKIVRNVSFILPILVLINELNYNLLKGMIEVFVTLGYQIAPQKQLNIMDPSFSHFSTSTMSRNESRSTSTSHSVARNTEDTTEDTSSHNMSYNSMFSSSYKAKIVSLATTKLVIKILGNY